MMDSFRGNGVQISPMVLDRVHRLETNMDSFIRSNRIHSVRPVDIVCIVRKFFEKINTRGPWRLSTSPDS